MNTTIRESQQESFEKVSAFLAGLSDHDLSKVSYHISMAHCEIRKAEGDRTAPVDAVAWLRDIIVDEYNWRQAVIWNTQADLNGGHLPIVSLEDVNGKWQAYCAPGFDDHAHWTGPNRGTLEEALADSKRHCPDVEPEVYG